MKLLQSEDLEESKGASLQSDEGLPTKMFADVQLLATTGDAVSGRHVCWEVLFEQGQHLDLAKGPIPPLDLFPPPIEELKPPNLLNA